MVMEQEDIEQKFKHCEPMKMSGSGWNPCIQVKTRYIFHVVWYTFELFPLYFSNGLHDHMAIIPPEVMKYDWDTSCKFIIDVTVVVSRSSKFVGHVTVVSYPIFTDLPTKSSVWQAKLQSSLWSIEV
jgi:hypothetical protein